MYFLHVLFVWRLCRIENVFWESLTCHKCFPSRNSKFRASKNRFYCVFPSQNSCKKEVFFTRGYFKAAIRLIVSEHSSSSLSRPTKIKLSEDISKKCRVWGGRILRMEFLPNCEAQGKGRAKGRPRKVTQRSFMDGGWWMVDILSLMLYIKFGCHHHHPPTGSLLISRIKPSMDQVR